MLSELLPCVFAEDEGPDQLEDALDRLEEEADGGSFDCAVDLIPLSG